MAAASREAAASTAVAVSAVATAAEAVAPFAGVASLRDQAANFRQPRGLAALRYSGFQLRRLDLQYLSEAISICSKRSWLPWFFSWGFASGLSLIPLLRPLAWPWHVLAVLVALAIGLAPGTALLNTVTGTFLYGFALGSWEFGAWAGLPGSGGKSAPHKTA